MSIKQTAAIVLGVAALGIGALSAFEPKSPQELEKARVEQQVQDLSDAQDREFERRRAEGEALGDALAQERSIPGEHRPPEDPRQPRIRIRIP